MPIVGLTDRGAEFPQIGSIRKGAPKPNDKQPGADLKYFRTEFDQAEERTAAKFVSVYGAQPTELNVFLPFNELDRNFDAWRETYVAGAMIHRCDGERIWYEINPKTGERLVVNGEPHKGCDCKGGCKPVGRLKVIIPELGRLAYLVVLTTSIHDIMNLSRQLQALSDIHGGRLVGIPLRLRRRSRKISTPNPQGGKRARREKSLLSIEADSEWVQAKIADLHRAALPNAGAPLGLPAPAVFEGQSRPLQGQPMAASLDRDDEDDEWGDEDQEPQAEQSAPDQQAATASPIWQKWGALAIQAQDMGIEIPKLDPAADDKDVARACTDLVKKIGAGAKVSKGNGNA